MTTVFGQFDADYLFGQFVDMAIPVKYYYMELNIL